MVKSNLVGYRTGYIGLQFVKKPIYCAFESVREMVMDFSVMTALSDSTVTHYEIS